MKKFFIFIVLAVTAVLTVSCNQSDGIMGYDSRQTPSGLRLIELTYEGHSHQFVFHHSLYDTELDHWPSCKYCTDSTDKEAKPARQELKSLQSQSVNLTLASH